MPPAVQAIGTRTAAGATHQAGRGPRQIASYMPWPVASRSGADDVGDAGTARDEAGPLVGHPVPDRARLVVAAVAGPQQRAPQALPERLDHLLAERGIVAGERLDRQLRHEASSRDCPSHHILAGRRAAKSGGWLGRMIALPTPGLRRAAAPAAPAHRPRARSILDCRR